MSSSVCGSNQAALKDHDYLLLGNLELQTGDNVPDMRLVQSYIGALLQSEHLNLLVGAGLTTAVSRAAGITSGADMNAPITTSDDDLNSALEKAAKESAVNTARGKSPNIEDRLRAAYTAQHGLEIVNDERASAINIAIKSALDQLRESVVSTEKKLREAKNQMGQTANEAIGLLNSFLTAFTGRTPTRDRLHLFTTNYDRVLEWGAEQVGIRILDRFVGTLEPVFRSSRLNIDYHYQPSGASKDPKYLDGVIRFTKLHGSLDWIWKSRSRQVVRRPVPFGEVPDDQSSNLLIYPNAAKDTETTLYPYSDLFRDFSAALCRPNSTLIIYGYSFGDDHINRIIRDMLTVPSSHLLIISFDDPGNRISNFVSEHKQSGQISLLRGPTFADLQKLTERWLPQSRATSIAQAQTNILGSMTYNDGDISDANLSNGV